MHASPLAVRPRPFSGYGVYELAAALITGAVAVLLLKSVIGSVLVLGEADRVGFWRALGITAAWAGAFMYAFRLFARDVSRDFVRRIGLLSFVLLAGAAVLVIANTRGYATEQGTVDAAAIVVFALMLVRAGSVVADVFGARSISFENGILTIRSLFGHTSVVDTREHKIVRVRYQVQPAEFGVKVRYWGQATFVCEQAGGIFLEESISRGWSTVDLEDFAREVNGRLSSSV